MYEITLATTLFLLYLMYTFKIYVKLLVNKEHRLKHQEKNKRLDELRKIAVKTPEQQKEFINLKYEIKPFFKWTFINILKAVWGMLPFIIIFVLFRYAWKEYIQINIPFWALIVFMLTVPLIINFLLRRFNMQQDDVTVYFRK